MIQEIAEAISALNSKAKFDHQLVDQLKPKSYNEWKLTNEFFFPERQSFTLHFVDEFDNMSNTSYNKMLDAISLLQENWDGYGAVVPSKVIISKTKAFLQNLPTYILNALDEEYIYPNPNGTLTVEWRKNGNSVSVELGINTANYLSKINSQYSGEEKIELIDKKPPINLIKDIQKAIS